MNESVASLSDFEDFNLSRKSFLILMVENVLTLFGGKKESN